MLQEKSAAAQTIEFANAALGAPPPDMEFVRSGQGSEGQWRVVGDETASGGRALEQSSADPTASRFPLAVVKSVSAKNLVASIRFKPVDGKVDRAGGIAVRLVGHDDDDIARANALEDNVRFYRVVKGRRSLLASANARVSANEWHTLGLRADGDRFTVSLNGKALYTVGDPTFQGPGKIALWTKADSVTRFERLEITRMD